jgi:hypothetical protein
VHSTAMTSSPRTARRPRCPHRQCARRTAHRAPQPCATTVPCVRPASRRTGPGRCDRATLIDITLRHGSEAMQPRSETAPRRVNRRSLATMDTDRRMSVPRATSRRLLARHPTNRVGTTDRRMCVPPQRMLPRRAVMPPRQSIGNTVTTNITADHDAAREHKARPTGGPRHQRINPLPRAGRTRVMRTRSCCPDTPSPDAGKHR